MAQNELKTNYSSSSLSGDEEEEEEEVEATGSEDEESSASESQEVSDSDSDEKQKQRKKPSIIFPPQIANKPQAPDLSSLETEQSGSDTDSDSPPKKNVIANPNFNPISSKPMEESKKFGFKTTSTPPPANIKRPAPAPASKKDFKKPKTNTNTDDDSKKQLFQRLWSEDDEIVILKGMIDYKTEKNGESPSGDMGAFHELIKKSLHVDVSRSQLVDKVRRLKKKYVNNVSREKNGKDRSFLKSHEHKCYELSKLIWGTDSYNNSGTEGKKNMNQSKKNGNANKGSAATASTSSAGTAVTLVKSNGLDEKEVSMMDFEKNMDISRFVQYGRIDGPVLTEEIMKGGFESLEGRERVEIEEKWKELKKQELEIFVKGMDLLKEQAIRVLEAVNSSRN